MDPIQRLEQMIAEVDQEIGKAASAPERFKSTKSVIIKSPDLPDNIPQLFSENGFTFEEGDEERVMKNVSSDGSVDRDGDIIHPDFWDLKDFKNNPLLLFQHDAGSPPVGGVLDVFAEANPDFEEAAKGLNFEEVEDLDDSHLAKRLSSFVTFAKTERGDEQFVLFKSGMMRAFSVRFRPSKAVELSKKQREALGMPKFGIFFKGQSLLELSTVTIPSNKNALVTAKQYQEQLHQFCLKQDDVLERLAKTLDEIKTVHEKQLQFDNMKAKLESFVEKAQGEPTKTQELYGSPVDADALSAFLSTAKSGVQQLQEG